MNSYQSACGVNLETLAAFVESRLAGDESERVRAHLAGGCRACAETMAWLKPIVEGLQGAGSFVRPSYSLDAAKAVFRDRMAAPARRPLLARLVLDTRSQPAYGLRGGPPQAYKLVYSTAAHDIDIWSEPQMDGGWCLIGQALPRDGSAPEPPGYATLSAGDTEPITLTMDGAEFHGEGLLSGAYDLRVGLSSGEILAPRIPIGA